ncbi:MAG: amidohydrolase family protein [Acidobacteria bacterium]|nr:amidohydrolase family protein [Acidobacteriota bacterium]
MLQTKRILKAMSPFVVCSFLVGMGIVTLAGRLAAQQKVPPASGWADTVLVNGKIATMNDTRRFVEGLAIRDGNVQAVGTTQEMEDFAGPHTRVVDLQGKTAVPGLISPHDHPHLWISWFQDTGSKLNAQWGTVAAVGNNPQDVTAAILRTVEQTVQQRKPGEWILVRTDEDGERAISGKTITVAQLDQVSPNNPVLVRAEIIDNAPSKTGKILSNIEAIRRAYEGYGPPLRSAARQMIVNSRAEEILKARGLLRGESPTMTTSMVMIGLIPESVGLDNYAEAIRRQLQWWGETQGVTTIATTFFNVPSVVTSYSRLAAANQMPVRMGWYTGINQFDVGSMQGIGDPYLWNLGVEYEVVVLEEVLAQQLDPSLYGTDLGGATTYASNLPFIVPRLEKLRADFVTASLRALPGQPAREEIMKWLRLGVRVGDVHCYSDGAIDMFLGILKQLQQETGWSDSKIKNMRNFYLTHNALTRPDQFPELAKYGMIVGPSWRTASNFPLLKKAYGEQVKQYIWPIKSLLAAGVTVAPNVDMNATTGPEGEGMWDILEFLVSREYAGEVWNQEEALDRWTALKTVTLMGAQVMLRENKLGSLDVGKLADLVVLDRDYFSVPVNEIGRISPAMTMVGGKIIYRAENAF